MNEKQYEFNYMMLGRLKSDLVQFFEKESFSYQKESNLWAGNFPEQISEMKKIWSNLTEKPEWLSMSDILKFESDYRLASNNMLHREGEVVEIGDAQDDEHYDFLKDYQGKQYIIARLNEDKETYYLKDLDGNYVRVGGIRTEFIDADLIKAGA